MTGTNDFTAVDAGTPDRFLCDACDRVTYPDELLVDLPKRELDELVKSGPLRPFAPERKTFVVAELDGKRAVASTVAAALGQLVAKTYALKQRLSRIEATSLEHAQDLVAQHHASMPWQEVKITRDLEPVEIGWHHGALCDWEKRRLESEAVVARIVETKALDVELEQIRQRRLSELA
jgi:hypothetical protein